MANTTASASGTKRYFATPLRKNIGTKTMQMASMETNAGMAICEVAVDVFNLNGRVVDKDANCKREAAQRHDVDRLPERRKREQRADDGERDRDGDDDGRAPVAEEDQDHGRGKAGGDQALAQHAVDRGLHKDGLVGDGPDVERGGKLIADMRQIGLDIVDNLERGGAAGLHYDHQSRALAVDADDVGLWRVTVAHVAHVVHIDGRPIDGLNGQIVESCDGFRRAVGLNLIVEVADLCIAGRRNYVLRADGVDDIGGGEPEGLQLLCVDVHLHIALLAAIRVGQRGAFHGCKLGADEVGAEVVELLLAETLAGEGQLQNRHAGGAVLDDERRAGALRILTDRGLADGSDLRHGLRDVDSGLEVNLGDGDAVEGLRLGVLDVIDRCGDDAVELYDDAVAQLLRR